MSLPWPGHWIPFQGRFNCSSQQVSDPCCSPSPAACSQPSSHCCEHTSTGPPLLPTDGHTSSSPWLQVWDMKGETPRCRAREWEDMSFPWHGPTSRASFGRNMDNAACAHSKAHFVSVYVHHTGLLLENWILLFVPSWGISSSTSSAAGTYWDFLPCTGWSWTLVRFSLRV